MNWPRTGLLCVQGTHWCVVIDLNATPLLEVRVRVRQLPPALLDRDREPQSHQMASWSLPAVLVERSGLVVFVCRPRMENVRVAEELDVTRIKNHMKRLA